MIKQIILLFIVYCLLLVGNGCGQPNSTAVTTSSTTTTTTLSVDGVLANMTFTSFEVFPINLERYFSSVDLTNLQNSILQGYHALITPFLQYTGNHPEGTGKWYIYPHAVAHEVYSPGRALIKKSDVQEKFDGGLNTGLVGTQPVYSNTSFNLHFDSDKKINLGHIEVIKALFDEIAASSEGYRFVAAGEHVGYTSYATALDVQMEDEAVFNRLSSSEAFGEHLVAALPYFSAAMQIEIMNYYNEYIYSKMVEGGKWPISGLAGPYNRGYANSIWSTWYHKSGLSPSASDGFWYFFPYGILSFLPRASTSSETFYRNPVLGTLITQEGFDWVGLYNDCQGIGNANSGNRRYVEILTGDGSTEGVCIMRPFISPTEESSLKYIRFMVDEKTAVYWDDELQIKFFDTSSEALADSFADPIVYIKDNNQGTPLPD